MMVLRLIIVSHGSDMMVRMMETMPIIIVFVVAMVILNNDRDSADYVDADVDVDDVVGAEDAFESDAF